MEISRIKYILLALIILHVSCIFNKTPDDILYINSTWQYSDLNYDLNNIKDPNNKNYHYLSFSIKDSPSLPFISYPVIEKGALVIMDKNGQLRKYQNKKILWTHNYDKQKQTEYSYLNGGLSYDNGIIFANYGTNVVKAINAQNGSLLWEVKLNDIMRSFPLIVGDKLILQANNNSLYALDKKNGQVIWYNARGDQNPKDLYITSPLSYKNTVILQHSYGISFIDLNSGVEKNYLEYQNYPQQDNKVLGIFQTSIVGNQLLYYDLNGYLSKFDLDKKTVSWQKLYQINRPLLVKNNYIFALDQNDQLMKINFINGDLIWIKNINEFMQKKYRKDYWSYPVSYNNKIYLQKKTGFMLVLDEDTGNKISLTKNKWQNIYLPPLSIEGQLFILDPK